MDDLVVDFLVFWDADVFDVDGEVVTLPFEDMDSARLVPEPERKTKR